jgi:hypothetical protein
MSDDDKKHLIVELQEIAASINDPVKREEVLKILARLSDEWPDADELLRIRLRYNDESK